MIRPYRISSDRTDKQGYSSKVTFLGKGFGIRIFKLGKIVSEGWADTKLDIGVKLKDMLRWLDKLGHDSDMASASRDRGK